MKEEISSGRTAVKRVVDVRLGIVPDGDVHKRIASFRCNLPASFVCNSMVQRLSSDLLNEIICVESFKNEKASGRGSVIDATRFVLYADISKENMT